jgi:ABC-2 type transport system ATP-binding protein
MAAVSARGVTKRFGRTCAVEEVELVVEQGEVRGLLGPNGAGKTTLLRMLLGLVRSDEGTIELFGRRLDQRGNAALDGVSGFVEDPSFYPYLSGRANLEVLAELDDGSSRDRIDEVLRRVELSGRDGDRVNGYSSGMRQRLGIAAALMRAPRLLILDEPTAGLDPGGVRFMSRLIGTLSEAGVAVLLSSHQIGEVEAVCDSFSVLHRGRVVWEGAAEQVRALAPPSAYRLSTSDDARALGLAQAQPGVQAEASPAGGLEVRAPAATMDSLVLALGQADVAIRLLEPTMSPLESMFFSLTEQEPGEADLAPALERSGVAQR